MIFRAPKSSATESFNPIHRQNDLIRRLVRPGVRKMLVRLTERIGVSIIAAGLFIVLSSPLLSAQTANDLFDGSVLQEIRLEINPKDWAALKANPSSNTYYPCNLKWRGMVVENVGIRQRGGSTRSSIKPGLRVDFNQYEDAQTFLGLKSIGLDNMTQIRLRPAVTTVSRLRALELLFERAQFELLRE